MDIYIYIYKHIYLKIKTYQEIGLDLHAGSAVVTYDQTLKNQSQGKLIIFRASIANIIQ